VYLQTGKITVKKCNFVVLRYFVLCCFILVFVASPLTVDSDQFRRDLQAPDVSVRRTFEALAQFRGVYVTVLYKSTFSCVLTPFYCYAEKKSF